MTWRIVTWNPRTIAGLSPPSGVEGAQPQVGPSPGNFLSSHLADVPFVCYLFISSLRRVSEGWKMAPICKFIHLQVSEVTFQVES